MTQHYLLQNAYGSFSAGEDAEDGGCLSSVFSAEVEKAKIICRCKWSAVSTAIASPCQNKLLLVPPKSRKQLLEEFSDEVTRVLARFAGLRAVVLPRPLGTEHVYCAAMMIPFGTVRLHLHNLRLQQKSGVTTKLPRIRSNRTKDPIMSSVSQCSQQMQCLLQQA